jgi:hypothetical protein
MIYNIQRFVNENILWVVYHLCVRVDIGIWIE